MERLTENVKPTIDRAEILDKIDKYANNALQ